MTVKMSRPQNLSQKCPDVTVKMLVTHGDRIPVLRLGPVGLDHPTTSQCRSCRSITVESTSTSKLHSAFTTVLDFCATLHVSIPVVFIWDITMFIWWIWSQHGEIWLSNTTEDPRRPLIDPSRTTDHSLSPLWVESPLAACLSRIKWSAAEWSFLSDLLLWKQRLFSQIKAISSAAAQMNEWSSFIWNEHWALIPARCSGRWHEQEKTPSTEQRQGAEVRNIIWNASVSVRIRSPEFQHQEQKDLFQILWGILTYFSTKYFF